MIAPETVRSALAKRGLSIRALARRHGMSPAYLYRALEKPLPSGNRIIAAFFGRDVHELWPEWFRSDGSRRIKRGTFVWEGIARRIEAGEIVDRILAEPGMPKPSAFRAYRQRNPEYDTRVRRALGRRPGTDAARMCTDDLDAVEAAFEAGLTIAEMKRRKIISQMSLRRHVTTNPIWAERLAKYYVPRSRPKARMSPEEKRDRCRAYNRVKRRRRRERMQDVSGIVEAAVSTRFPPQMRDEIKGDLTLALLAGEVMPQDAKRAAEKLATCYNRAFNRPDLSMDEDRGGYTLAGLIADRSFETDGTGISVTSAGW